MCVGEVLHPDGIPGHNPKPSQRIILQMQINERLSTKSQEQVHSQTPLDSKGEPQIHFFKTLCAIMTSELFCETFFHSIYMFIYLFPP